MLLPLGVKRQLLLDRILQLTFSSFCPEAIGDEALLQSKMEPLGHKCGTWAGNLNTQLLLSLTTFINDFKTNHPKSLYPLVFKTCSKISESLSFFVFMFSDLLRVVLVVQFTQSCLTLCNPMDCSMPGFSVPHHLLESAQVHVHCIRDAVQPPHPLMPSSP